MAAAVTVLIAGIIVGLISNSLIRWSRAKSSLMADGQARQVFDHLGRDLPGAVSRGDGNAWLIATIQPESSASGVWVAGGKPAAASLNAAAPDLTEARFGLAGTWLRLITTQRNNNLTGEPAGPVAVSYQLVRRPPTASAQNCCYLLYRAEASSTATIAAGYDLSAAAYTDGTDVRGSAGNIARPRVEQALAINVVDFGLRLYAYAAGPTAGTLTLRQVFPLNGADLEYRAQRLSPGDVSRRNAPAVVDIFLRMLTDEGARRIAALEAGQIDGDWWAIANANSKVFVHRFVLASDAF